MPETKNRIRIDTQMAEACSAEQQGTRWKSINKILAVPGEKKRMAMVVDPEPLIEGAGYGVWLTAADTRFIAVAAAIGDVACPALIPKSEAPTHRNDERIVDFEKSDCEWELLRTADEFPAAHTAVPDPAEITPSNYETIGLNVNLLMSVAKAIGANKHNGDGECRVILMVPKSGGAAENKLRMLVVPSSLDMRGTFGVLMGVEPTRFRREKGGLDFKIVETADLVRAYKDDMTEAFKKKDGDK